MSKWVLVGAVSQPHADVYRKISVDTQIQHSEHIETVESIPLWSMDTNNFKLCQFIRDMPVHSQAHMPSAARFTGHTVTSMWQASASNRSNHLSYKG
jgi:hypothetical protein